MVMGVHTVHAVCRNPACDHWQELDLAALVAAGQGDVADPTAVAVQRVRRPGA
jgi:hypothetical protein